MLRIFRSRSHRDGNQLDSSSPTKHGTVHPPETSSSESETNGPSEFQQELDQINRLIADGQLDAQQKLEQLTDLAYRRLYRIAERLVGYMPGTPTMGPTAVVNEGFARLADSGSLASVNDAVHFYSLFARCMKHALIDYARHRMSEKAGGKMRRIDFDMMLDNVGSDPSQMIEIADTLQMLHSADARAADVLEVQVFGRLKVAEIAALHNVSKSTIEDHLRYAKAFIRAKLE